MRGVLKFLLKDKPLKIQRGDPWGKKYFFHKSSSILFRVGSNDQKLYADSKNIHINRVGGSGSDAATATTAAATATTTATVNTIATPLIYIFLESAQNF